jgi:hypothetical protein
MKIFRSRNHCYKLIQFDIFGASVSLLLYRLKKRVKSGDAVFKEDRRGMKSQHIFAETLAFCGDIVAMGLQETKDLKV